MGPFNLSREELDDIWRRNGCSEEVIARMIPEERNLAVLLIPELDEYTYPQQQQQQQPQQQDQQPTASLILQPSAPPVPQLQEPAPTFSAELPMRPIPLTDFTKEKKVARAREQDRNAADRYQIQKRQAEVKGAQNMRETQQHADRYQQAYEMLLAAVNNSISSVFSRQLTAEQAMELLEQNAAEVEAGLWVDGG